MDVEFMYTTDDFITRFASAVVDEDIRLSKFDEILRKKWDHAMEQGYFKYKLDSVLTRIVPGKFEIVLQLNPKRQKLKRRAEFVTNLQMPFDPDKFNFNKIRPEEILINMEFMENESNKSFTCPVIINMSPLGFGHVLLVPDAQACMPQVLTQQAMRVGVHFLLLTSHRGVYVAFNGLCAMASVNHLHLHAWYLEYPTFPQTAPVQKICGDLHMTLDLPVPAYVFELCEENVERLIRCVFTVCSHLQRNEIAHNMMLLRGKSFKDDQTWSIRAYIWPRKAIIGEKNAEFLPFNLAVAELCCHIPYYDADTFHQITEDALVAKVREECLPSEQLEQLTRTLCSQYKDIFTEQTLEVSVSNDV